MKLILICGPWSSGTSAISGMLHALGLDGVGPYHKTNDPQTPTSMESLAFRRAVQSVASEDTLERTKSSKDILERLNGFKTELEAHRAERALPSDSPLFLKYPLSALLLPEMAKLFDIRLIYVIRPLLDIESTRARRGWKANLGAKGATVIYSSMFQFMVNNASTTMIVRYSEVLQAPHQHARRLANFVGLKNVSQLQIDASAAVVRPATPGKR